MTRRSPRSTLFPYTNALPISHEGKDFTAIPGTAESSVLVVGESTWLIGQFESEDQDLEKEIYDLHYSNVAGSAKDRKSTRLNSSHPSISYAVFCLKKKRTTTR